MRVLGACSLGGAGHLGPLRPFLDAARRRGAETLVVAPPSMAAMVDETGHPFVPGGEPDEREISGIREQLPLVPPTEASVLGNRELFGHLATTAMLPAMGRTVDRWRPDLVLRDPCEYASAVVAAERELPVAQVAISLAEVEWGSIAIAAPALEEHRSGLTDLVRHTAYLTRIPESLDPSPFPSTMRVRDGAAARRKALPRWWGDDDRPLVYVTLGTVLGRLRDAAQRFTVLVDAVAHLEARVLVTVGPAFDPLRLGPIPTGVHVERWIDQAEVLAEAAVVVCHGGSGTTFGALAAGVPLVVVPQFADQLVNADRVANAGAGVTVPVTFAPDGTRRSLEPQDAPRIRAAIELVQRDPSYMRAARSIAADTASAPVVDEALETLMGS